MNNAILVSSGWRQLADDARRGPVRFAAYGGRAGTRSATCETDRSGRWRRMSMVVWAGYLGGRMNAEPGSSAVGRHKGAPCHSALKHASPEKSRGFLQLGVPHTIHPAAVSADGDAHPQRIGQGSELLQRRSGRNRTASRKPRVVACFFDRSNHRDVRFRPASTRRLSSLQRMTPGLTPGFGSVFSLKPATGHRSRPGSLAGQ